MHSIYPFYYALPCLPGLTFLTIGGFILRKFGGANLLITIISRIFGIFAADI